MTYEIRRTKEFKQNVKLCIRRGKDIEKLLAVVKKLANGEELPEVNRNHLLVGDYSGCWECHIEPDWLLVYRRNNQKLILVLTNTGTHSDIFG